MTKKEIIELVARKSHLTKKAASECITVFLDEIGRVLSKGEEVGLSGFGTFRVKSMKGKTVKVPKSNQVVTVKTHRLPRFTTGNRLRRQINK